MELAKNFVIELRIVACSYWQNAGDFEGRCEPDVASLKKKQFVISCLSGFCDLRHFRALYPSLITKVVFGRIESKQTLSEHESPLF